MKVGDRVKVHYWYEIPNGTIIEPSWLNSDLGYWIVKLDKPTRLLLCNDDEDIIEEMEDNLEVIE